MEAFRDGYDVARPSAFELFAEHQLDGHFKPALAFVVAHYAQRFPRYLIPLLNRIDEVHLLLAAVANAYYLRIWNGSVAQNFYNLRLASSAAILAGHGHIPLTRRLRRHALLALLLPAYLGAKLDAFFQLDRPEAEQQLDELLLDDDPQDAVAAPANPTAPHRTAWRRQVWYTRSRAVYRHLKRVMGLVSLLLQLGYLTDRSRWFSWPLALAGLEPVRIAQADVARKDAMDAARLAAAVGDAVPPAATRLGRLRRAARVALAASRARAVQHAHHVLPAGIMIYRFLEWWQTSELAQGPADPIPPPPPPLAPHPKGVAVPEDPRACPLCGAAPRVTPAALPSGYVFCYTCIVPSLQEHRRCPVTWAPMDVSAVRRLYVSD